MAAPYHRDARRGTLGASLPVAVRWGRVAAAQMEEGAMRLFMIAAALCGMAAPAAAETWRSIGWAGEKPARFFYFVDVDSVTREGDLVTFWEQESLEADEPDGTNRVFNYRRGNCATLSTQILRSRYLNRTRLIEETQGSGEWVEHPEGSMMGDGLKMICGRLNYATGPLADPDAHARRFFANN
jgi:hypothetical protein